MSFSLVSSGATRTDGEAKRTERLAVEKQHAVGQRRHGLAMRVFCQFQLQAPAAPPGARTWQRCVRART
eukprot:6172958-Pleurochrysis_carterae.AAC.2